MTATTAVIPAAGLGTRFLPATKALPKGMIAVIDRPAIQYVVEEAVAAGLRDIVIVSSPGAAILERHFARDEQLERALEAAGKTAEAETIRAIAELADITYVTQREPLGLGHAVAMARTHVGDSPFAVLLGDDLIAPQHAVLGEMLRVQAERDASVIALKEVTAKEVSLYGCAAAERIDERLVRVSGVVEKPTPEAAPSNLAVMGRYVFTPSIFDALDEVKPGKGGEIQLTDAIGLLLGTESVYGWTFARGRYDAGSKLGFLVATVELALARDDLADDFRAFLVDLLEQPPPTS